MRKDTGGACEVTFRFSPQVQTNLYRIDPCGVRHGVGLSIGKGVGAVFRQTRVERQEIVSLIWH
jgi:hypothetical protein